MERAHAPGVLAQEIGNRALLRRGVFGWRGGGKPRTRLRFGSVRRLGSRVTALEHNAGLH